MSGNTEETNAKYLEFIIFFQKKFFLTEISFTQGVGGKKCLGSCFCFADSSSFEFMGFLYKLGR